MRAWLSKFDARVRWVVSALIFLIVATAIPFIFDGILRFFNVSTNPSTLFGAVFASWIGGLALFVFGGAAVALISLWDPTKEAFDSRARILFRRQSGFHIDYIVSRIKEALEHYAETLKTKVIIYEYNTEGKKFRLSWDAKTTIRSYIDDIESTYTSKIELTEVTDAPAKAARNSIKHLRINGIAKLDRPREFDRDVNVPIETSVSRDSVGEVEYCVEIWFSADTEPNIFSPVRYTQMVELEIENRCGVPVGIKISKDHGKSWDEVNLDHGNSRVLLKKNDVKPGTEVYRYHILKPKN